MLAFRPVDAETETQFRGILQALITSQQELEDLASFITTVVVAQSAVAAVTYVDSQNSLH